MKNIKKVVTGIIGVAVIGGGAFTTLKMNEKNVDDNIIPVQIEEKVDSQQVNANNTNEIKKDELIKKEDCSEEFLKDMKTVYNITVEDCTKFETTGERYAICENIQRKWKDKELNESENKLFEALWFERKDGLYKFLPPLMDEVPATRKAINENLGKIKELSYLFEEV